MPEPLNETGVRPAIYRNKFARPMIAAGAAIGLALSSYGGYELSKIPGIEKGLSGSDYEQSIRQSACIGFTRALVDTDGQRPIVLYADLSMEEKANCEVDELFEAQTSSQAQVTTSSAQVSLPTIEAQTESYEASLRSASIMEDTDRVLGAGVGAFSFLVLVGVGGIAISSMRRS